MRFNLFNNARNSYNDIDNILYQVLENREVDNPSEYLALINDDSVEISPDLLDNIHKAKEVLLDCIDKKWHVQIIVDPDVDGVASAAMMYNYIVKDIGYDNVSYSLHTGKQHGITKDITILENTKLLIVPDASSNEEHIHKQLYEKGIDIIVLDHHQADYYSCYATVVNNQLSDKYYNKELSGAGIVYKFLQVLDDELWISESEKYLDLVALAQISDSMDIRSLETRYYINKGLDNIRNKAFKALIDKRSYDIKGQVTINNVAFYITPLINALIRVGKQDEKELLFNAFIENDMTFKYKKRGQDELVDESIYDRVARLATNARSRQARAIDKALAGITDDINTKRKYKNKLIVVNADDVEKTLTGIVAIKVANQYKRPCLVVRKNDKTGLYSGSGRNTDYSAIDDLREYITQTGLASVEGHDNAFGIIDLEPNNISKLIEIFNQDDSLDSNPYWVDFIIPFDDLSDELIFTINNLKNQWGMGIKEPIIAVTDIEVHNEEIEVLGANLDTLKVNIDGVSFIKFKCNLDDELINNKKDVVSLNIVGKCSVNEWNGTVTPQIIIEEYQIIQ